MAAYELIQKYDNRYIIKLINSYDSFVLADYVKELLLTLPKEQRDAAIMSNIKFAYFIADELENEDPIVDYICEECPHAGDILSDEIVLKCGLKRSVLEEEDICKDCDFC